MIIPETEIDNLQPIVRDMFRQWAGFMYGRVRFNMPDSPIHALGHCERVLLYALVLGVEIFGDDREALEILAHASAFHDTRRQDDYLDTGHGARAAVYYRQFCEDNPDITFHPESVLLMRYHDLDDTLGREAVENDFPADVRRVGKLYDIFKDADALDRWRLGRRGLDPRFLRTPESRRLVEYARRLVGETVDPHLLASIEREVDEAIERQRKSRK